MSKIILKTFIFSLIFAVLIINSSCKKVDDGEQQETNLPESVSSDSNEDFNCDKESCEDCEEYLQLEETQIIDDSATAPTLENLNDTDRQELAELLDSVNAAIPYTDEDKALDDKLGKDVGDWLKPESNETAEEK
ncbi:MAG: hypothetical protein LBE20_05445 [Deltaproteobacteria bacterium]|jgi:hypothetical protein|nr:hypothetical protein [Deltaproteobacteria bacterium]